MSSKSDPHFFFLLPFSDDVSLLSFFLSVCLSTGQALDVDRGVLHKIKKSVKSISSSGLGKCQEVTQLHPFQTQCDEIL